MVDVQPCTYFDCYIALGDFPHVESDSWDHVFIELSWLENKTENTNILVKTHSERDISSNSGTTWWTNCMTSYPDIL